MFIPNLVYLISSSVLTPWMCFELPQYWLSLLVFLLHPPAELVEGMVQCLILPLVISESQLSLTEDLVSFAVVKESLLEMLSHLCKSDCICASNVAF